MKKVRCAVVGCGVIGPVHAEALSRSERAQLVATVDIVPERARTLAEKYKAESWYDDYTKVLERSDIDAVFICTPHYLHSPMVVDAARHGKHVLVEKPLATDSATASMAVTACKEAGVRLAVCFQNRFNPATSAVKRAIERGVLGDLISVTGNVSWYRPEEYYTESLWRGRWETEGGGVLINQAIHTLDLLLYFAGDVRSFSATLDRLGHSSVEVEDVASISMKFSSGAIGNFFASTCSYPGFDVRIEVTGTNGSAVIEGDKLTYFKTITGDTYSLEEEDSDLVTAAKSYYGSSHPRLIEDFLDSVINDRAPLVTGEEGKRSIDLLDAIYREYRQQCAK